MKRPLRPDEARLWAVVAATVRPAPGRAPPAIPAAPPAADPSRPQPIAHSARGSAPTKTKRPHPLPLTPEGIEPNRRHRIARGRDALAARLDLHGMTQDQARVRLADFLRRAQSEGERAVLVITGKGVAGEGVLRRRAPEWLADPRLRDVVAGLSPADPRHGGDGAYYVALKRRGSPRSL